MTLHPLTELVNRRKAGGGGGLVSVCSAHPRVIGTALAAARAAGQIALIEATCNQVNQDGGYTGMRPADFRAFVEEKARAAELPPEQLMLGGDHLGPNPWRRDPPEAAMEKARAMIAGFAAAGFTKLHLDCSMGCAGEPAALDDETVAARAADLARAAEAALPEGAPRPVYIVGTEVPVPGGATGPHAVEVTRPEAARATVEVHRRAFEAAGLGELFATRVHGLVTQPGVEFDNEEILRYDPVAAAGLSALLPELSGFVFEAHSTDYQSSGALAALVRDGFAILKVGPALTFALREGLYGLARIAVAMGRPGGDLPARMEALMLAQPADWEPYCGGTDREREIARHFGFSDRIRYYWPRPEAEAAVSALLDALGDAPLPLALVRAHLPQLWEEIVSGDLKPRPEELLGACIRRELAPYFAATGA